MALILPRVGYFVKQRFHKRFRQCRQASVRVRYLIIINVWNGRSARAIEKVLNVHNTTVYRVIKRFRERGEASLHRGDHVLATEGSAVVPEPTSSTVRGAHRHGVRRQPFGRLQPLRRAGMGESPRRSHRARELSRRGYGRAEAPSPGQDARRRGARAQEIPAVVGDAHVAPGQRRRAIRNVAAAQAAWKVPLILFLSAICMWTSEFAQQ